MKTRIKLIIYSFTGILILGACEKLLEEVDQKGATPVSDFYMTDRDADEAIAAVYIQLRSNYMLWFFVNTTLSDDVNTGGGNRSDVPGLERLNEYTFVPANNAIRYYFSGLYTLLYRCNLVINNISGGTPIQDRVIAEARVARAFANFNLVAMWGTPPLVLHELAPGEYSQPNGDPAEFWEQIENDLTEAINSGDLPEKSSAIDQSVGTRMTRQLAQVLLGKAYLWQENYVLAANLFDEVIGSGLYELIPDFENICRAVQDLGPERVFEVIALSDPNKPGQGLNELTNYLGWRGDHMNMAGYFSGAHDIHFLGWGFFNATRDVYDAFIEMEEEDGFRLNGSIMTYQQVLAICTVPGEELYVKPMGLYGHSGLFTWKHRIIRSELNPSGIPVCWSTNFQYIRYAEVLLLGAEASLLSGDETSALDYINQVRKRAQLDLLTTVTLEDIKKEKRLECWNEGVRYLDLQRWGDAASALANQGDRVPYFWGFKTDGITDSITYTYPNTDYGYKVGKHEFLPFPESEIDVNPNLVQNPGW
jgi:hypothetical protein